ncbi:MAG TPA: hypothetical protein VHE36_04765 [Sphingomicrobium sp.]|nr:hypothetical protein [Sphingomicrobium sp.]
MLVDWGANAIVYQVLDEVLGQRSVPAGARAAMFAVVDELRFANALEEDVRRAERISLEMHKMEWALCRGDAAESEAAHEELKALAAEWINRRISSRH